jgi:hypothetical protein
VIAMTEASPVAEMWRVAMRFLGDSRADLVALFLADDRWLRVASLPFTREFPRVGGRPSEFTRQRAEELHRDAAREARRLIDALAGEARIKTVFEILSESDRARLAELVGGASSILIAPTLIRSRPVYAELIEIGCRIELIEAPKPADADLHRREQGSILP